MIEYCLYVRETNRRKQHQVIHYIIHWYFATMLFAPFLCMYTPVVYSGIMTVTVYICDAPNKLFKDKKKHGVGENMLKIT